MQDTVFAHIQSAKGATGTGMAVNADGSAEVAITSAPTLEVEGEVEITSGQIDATTTPGEGTGATSAVSVGTSSGTLLTANANRRWFSVFNLGTGRIYINWGAAASVTTSFPVPAGGKFDAPCSASNGEEITAITDTGAQDVRVVEFTGSA